MTRCDLLNELLAKQGDALSIPQFRRFVSVTGNNLGWLQSRIATSHDCPSDLRTALEESNTRNLSKEVICD